jgi:BCD family chlorophyll transporter-like MFS transporter
MNAAPEAQRGLALGAWGAVQASAAGVAVGLGGALRDVVGVSPLAAKLGPAIGYIVVYCIELVLLAATIVVVMPLIRTRTLEPSAAAPSV